MRRNKNRVFAVAADPLRVVQEQCHGITKQLKRDTDNVR